MSTSPLEGILAYPITPYFEDTGKVDLDTLGQVIDNLIETGVCAIAALGSAGEAAYLDEDEWLQVADHTIKQVAGRVPVVIGIAELTTDKAVERAKYVDKIGADVVMISPIAYYALSEEEIYHHYETISAAVNIPIMLYNNPATSGIDMSPEFMLRMVHGIDNVKLIKESSGDIQRMHKIYALSDGKVPFYNGCNYLAYEAINAGATGWCTAAPCLIGDKPKRLFDLIQAGDTLKAREVFYQTLDFLEFIVKKGLASSVKAGLAMQGINAGTARRPLLELPTTDKEQLKRLLDEILKS